MRVRSMGSVWLLLLWGWRLGGRYLGFAPYVSLAVARITPGFPHLQTTEKGMQAGGSGDITGSGDPCSEPLSGEGRGVI